MKEDINDKGVLWTSETRDGGGAMAYIELRDVGSIREEGGRWGPPAAGA